MGLELLLAESILWVEKLIPNSGKELCKFNFIVWPGREEWIIKHVQKQSFGNRNDELLTNFVVIVTQNDQNPISDPFITHQTTFNSPTQLISCKNIFTLNVIRLIFMSHSVK